MEPTRRNFLGGLIALCAAPAIVRIDNIMPVKAIVLSPSHPWYDHPSWLELRNHMLRHVDKIAQQVEDPPAIYAQHFDAVMKGLLPGGLPLGTSRYSVPHGQWIGVCPPTDMAWLKNVRPA